jgi:hypothetical protein
MIQFRIDINQAVNHIQDLPRRLRRAELQVLRETGDKIVARAKQILVSHGYSDTHKAINSIYRRVTGVGENFSLVVWSNLPYAEYLDTGTRKHFVSFYGGRGRRRHLLVSWALRHGLVTESNGKLINTNSGKPMTGMYVQLERTEYLSSTFEQAKIDFVQRSGRVL